MAELKYGEIDQARVEMAVRELLLAIGEDPDREGLVDTSARGIKKPGSLTVTSAVRGSFREDEKTRAEALSLFK